jgi:putative SOS response-associated peptidase YedK
MCGRYYRRSDKQRITEAFRIGVPPTFEILPDYNVAPATMQPVIVEDRDSGERTLRPMHWGMIPTWCDDPKKLGVSTINAKAESLMSKPIWRVAVQQAALPCAGRWFLRVGEDRYEDEAALGFRARKRRTACIRRIVGALEGA